jgi:hypothetical protein
MNQLRLLTLKYELLKYLHIYKPHLYQKHVELKEQLKVCSR